MYRSVKATARNFSFPFPFHSGFSRYLRHFIHTNGNEPKKGDRGNLVFRRSMTPLTLFKKVIVGMSGGVDSSVAALLLAKEVHFIIITMS